MVHSFSACGVKMAVDVNSGAVHVLDDVCFDILQVIENGQGNPTEEEIILQLASKYEEEDIREAIAELDELKEDGLLFSEGKEYENIAATAFSKEPVVKSLCLNVAHDCNLRCKYCFASTGEYQGKRELMSLEVGKKAIDFLLQKSGARKNLEVDFFGGEPLINFEVVKGIVEYAREREKEYGKSIKFTITTNAVLLDKEKRDYINKNMYNVVLSLDGRKEVNDNMRPKVDGSGSYNTIINNIRSMVKERENKSFYVRGTYTKHNLDFAKDVLAMADEDFKNISVEPVVADSKEEYAITEKDIPEICAEYEVLANEYIKRHKAGKGFTFFHFMIDLAQGPCVIKRMKGCSAGVEYLAIAPSGDMYPCHQFVGQDEFIIGSVFEGIKNTELPAKFQSVNIFTKDECKNCWAKFYCSGGCVANSNNFNKDIKKPYKVSCEIEKKRLECALAIKASLQE